MHQGALPSWFYSSEVVVGDMRRHGIELLSPDINLSAWGYTVAHQRALRMGCKRWPGWARLPKPLVSDLIRAGLFDALTDRRTLLWQLGEIEVVPDALPLDVPFSQAALPQLEEMEADIWSYELMGQ